MDFWHFVVICGFVFAFALLISINKTHVNNIKLKMKYDELEEKYNEKYDLILSYSETIRELRTEVHSKDVEISKLKFDMKLLENKLDKE